MASSRAAGTADSPTPARVLPFRPERTWSYEAGVKSELFDRRLRLNVNGYLADTKDIQITSGIIPPGETAIVSLARNAGTLRAYGVPNGKPPISSTATSICS